MSGKCKSNEEIKNFFYRKFFSIYYTDQNIDTGDYESPLKSIIRNDYHMIDLKLRKISNIFLKNIEISTDDGAVFSNRHIITDIHYDKEIVDFFLVKEDNISEPLFQCFLFSSKSKQNIQRIYQKLTEAFAN